MAEIDEHELPPAASLSERLTAEFYRWEKRGRGEEVWGYPVELEPPFEPFWPYRPCFAPVPDDGRKPTLFSRLAEGCGRMWQRIRGVEPETRLDGDIPWEPEPETFSADDPICELGLAPRPDLCPTVEQAEQFLLTLEACAGPVSFELIGSQDAVRVQFACREPDVWEVLHKLRGFFPDAPVFSERTELLDPLADPDRSTFAVDFGLSHEFMRPLRTFRRFDPDPLIGIIAVLDALGPGELGMLQVLFQAARQPWAENVLRAVTDGRGGSFFADDPEMPKLARAKTERPLYAAVIRVVGHALAPERAGQIAQALGGGLKQLAHPHSNELIPLTNAGYPDEDHIADVPERVTRRSGALLNSAELVGLVHPPSASVRAAKLVRQVKHTKPPPPEARGHALVLGENTHERRTVPVTIGPDHRVRHMHVVGKTGTGKSTFLLALILQDIEQGLGMAVLDPHGDLIDQVIAHLPESRWDDVVLIDPADADYPVGLNILVPRPIVAMPAAQEKPRSLRAQKCATSKSAP